MTPLLLLPVPVALALLATRRGAARRKKTAHSHVVIWTVEGRSPTCGISSRTSGLVRERGASGTRTAMSPLSSSRRGLGRPRPLRLVGGTSSTLTQWDATSATGCSTSIREVLPAGPSAGGEEMSRDR